MSERPKAFQTTHGMAWYPEDSDTYIFVDRMATIRGQAVLGVRSVYDGGESMTRLQIIVSKGGRSIRVFDDSGRQWRPE